MPRWVYYLSSPGLRELVFLLAYKPNYVLRQLPFINTIYDCFLESDWENSTEICSYSSLFFFFFNKIHSFFKNLLDSLHTFLLQMKG